MTQEFIIVLVSLTAEIKKYVVMLSRVLLTLTLASGYITLPLPRSTSLIEKQGWYGGWQMHELKRLALPLEKSDRFISNISKIYCFKI